MRNEEIIPAAHASSLVARALDIRYMQHALALAGRMLGRTWPNPAVGALIVKDGVIVGAAATARGGRPHAETRAIEEAGAKAKGATLYVTLEPCSHTGKTPPCAEAIIKAGLARVVAAIGDPSPQVSGKGFAMLKAAGIAVTQGVCEEEARHSHEGFFSVAERKRPFTALKIASSLDGKIADAQGASKWITGEAARARGHALRAGCDAIMTGIGTVLADNPQMTVRLPGREEDSPQRVVLDGDFRIPPKAKILPAWIITSDAAHKKEVKKAAILEKQGGRILTAARKDGRLYLPEIWKWLAKEGITRLLVEAGSELATAAMQAGLIDRIFWFRAPLVIGEKGLSALKGSDAPLAGLARFRLLDMQRLGQDTLEIYDIDSSITNN